MFCKLFSWTCIAMVLGAIAASTASAETILKAYDSCRTVMSKPNENDSSNRLVVRTEQGDPTRSLKSWIRFDVSGVDVQSLTSATLVTTLWKDRGSCELDVAYVNDGVVENINWTTKDLTWNNAPGNDPTSEGLLDPNETTPLGRPRLIGGLAGDQFIVDALEALQTDTDGIVQFVLHNASAYLQIAHHQDPCEAWRPFLIVNEGPTDKARKPSPADGAEDVDPLSILSWRPGGFAEKHGVYFGTDFDDVNDGVALVSPGQDANWYDPAGLLALETTYYWRIDEINAPPDSTVVKGDVWSFTTEAYAYPLSRSNVIATASSSDKAESGPQNTVDGSGLTDDLHSTATTAMWLSSLAGPEPVRIQYEFDRVYKLHELWAWNYNVELEPIVGYGFKDVAIEYSLDGTTWTLLKEIQFAQAAAANGYAHNTTVTLDGVVARYVRLTAKSNWSMIGLKQCGLSEVRFFHVPMAARDPEPATGVTGVPLDTTLSWRAGREAASHEIHLGTALQAVTDSTAPSATVSQAEYAPADLQLDTTYYWKVIEVNQAETPSRWAGKVWSFTTSPSTVVDDFESYTNKSPKRVFQTWIDGVGFSPDDLFPNGNKGNGTGSYAGYDPALGSIMETKIVHGGRQSLPFSYNGLSEITRTLDPAQDWTRGGIRTLVLFFQGPSTNGPGELYVKINGTKVSYNGNAGDLAAGAWKQWNVDLPAAGLGAVKTLTIGVSSGQGLLLIDDLGLYRTAPVIP